MENESSRTRTDADAGGTVPDSRGGGDDADTVIRIRGARVHNLQNVDLDLPRDRLIVLTGPSGSGKSSLAFDTLVAEGQRQYIETLSTYARQFLHQLERADVDSIEGLPPTIAVDQRGSNQNPRSTVATVSEIYDYLRVLMARLGEAACPECGTPIQPRSPEEILEELLRQPAGTKLMLLAPLVAGRKGAHEEVFAEIRKAGLLRARVDGAIVDADPPPALERSKPHTIEAVVDRIVVREGIGDRLAESLRLALSQGQGAVIASVLGPAEGAGARGGAGGGFRDTLYSTLNCCPQCGRSFAEIEPRTFSFNSPYGACGACEGLGARWTFDERLALPDESLSLERGAVAPWRGCTAAAKRRQRSALEPFLAERGLGWNFALRDWREGDRAEFWRGSGGAAAAARKGGAKAAAGFLGLKNLLEKEYAVAVKQEERDRLAPYRGEVACEECGGARLRPEARSVRFCGRAIQELTGLSVDRAAEFFGSAEPRGDLASVYGPLRGEISGRLRFLQKVGLGYLALARGADSLSGGEFQRLRLATAIGSGLVGVCYVLDEPSIGLHPRDNGRLIESLRDLQRQGNTVVAVEHDEATMRAADVLVDIGPGAGAEGGRIVTQGTPVEVAADAHSITGGYLSGRLVIAIPERRRKGANARSIVLNGATTHNLKGVDARFPLGLLVCVTGVSGSGKSSLVNDTLARGVKRRLTGGGEAPGPYTSLTGVRQIDRLVEVDQAPLGRTPRSNPASYTGVFDEIRKVYAGTKQARQLGYKASRFSFNAKGGRCEECAGHGVRKISMDFLPDLSLPCAVCGGRRFNEATLAVRYRERSIADALAMSVEEAAGFFENFPALRGGLAVLAEVGLGYVRLGQPATTLSGGEAQRVKLAAELGRMGVGHTLYVMDEPTTGLHFDDIRRLLGVLGRLVDAGNSVIVIEHNLDVIKTADWVIDLGPEGGEGGGRIVACGTPEEVAATEGSLTGAYLRQVLG